MTDGSKKPMSNRVNVYTVTFYWDPLSIGYEINYVIDVK